MLRRFIPYARPPSVRRVCGMRWMLKLVTAAGPGTGQRKESLSMGVAGSAAVGGSGPGKEPCGRCRCEVGPYVIERQHRYLDGLASLTLYGLTGCCKGIMPTDSACRDSVAGGIFFFVTWP